MTTSEDVATHRRQGPWKSLERLAQVMVAEAQNRAGTAFTPLLGGGKRLMLALEHRISDDIALLIRDPQWIGLLTPRLMTASRTPSRATRRVLRR